jgi:hypothetical protein
MVAPAGQKEASCAKGGDPSNFLDLDIPWREELHVQEAIRDFKG